MRYRNWILFAIFAALVLLPPTQIPSAQFKTTIEGVVIDQESGSPVGGARVYFSQETVFAREVPFVTTDPQGRFAIDVRAAGQYRLLPEKTGYVYSRPARLKTPRRVVFVQVSGQGPAPRVELPMVKEGIIAGQILDSVTGQPMPSVAVRLGVPSYSGKGDIFAELGFPTERSAGTEIHTNDRGEYRLFGLPQGEYYVAYTRYVRDSAAPIVGHVLGYYPGVDRVASAVLLQVEAGKETQAAPILLDPPSKAVQVRFRYGGTNLQLASGVSPSMMFTADNFETSIRVGRENDETPLRMGRGRYDLKFQILSATGDTLYSLMNFDVGTENLEKEVILTRAASVTGAITLRDASGKTLDGSGISCSLDGTGQLLTERSGRGARSGCVEAKAAMGSYQLRVSLPADAFIVSAKAGQRDVLRDGIEVAQRDVHLEIEAATPGSVISGVVTDDKNNPLSDATVVLVPDAPYRNAIVLYRSEVSAFDGRFGLRGVAPGTYRVFAWTDLSGPAYRNPEFLKKYEDKGTPLKIENSTPVSLKLIALE
jgi:5-hydroxyisourate hydrolase-like protein (transthyretin family)